MWSSSCKLEKFREELILYAGVLTKLDIMDPGTSAREILDGTSIKLKHGWIGVVNRGQKDIVNRVRISLALISACLICLLLYAS